MIADWTEVVLVNKRSWTVRLSYASFYSSPFERSLTHFTKLSSWKQSVSIIYYTRIHRVAVEFLRNIVRSNLGLTNPIQNKSGYAEVIGTNFLSLIFHHTNNISITYVSWNEHLSSFFISSFKLAWIYRLRDVVYIS